jgi:hypothetical protein
MSRDGQRLAFVGAFDNLDEGISSADQERPSVIAELTKRGEDRASTVGRRNRPAGPGTCIGVGPDDVKYSFST